MSISHWSTPQTCNYCSSEIHNICDQQRVQKMALEFKLHKKKIDHTKPKNKRADIKALTETMSPLSANFVSQLPNKGTCYRVENEEGVIT